VQKFFSPKLEISLPSYTHHWCWLCSPGSWRECQKKWQLFFFWHKNIYLPLFYLIILYIGIPCSRCAREHNISSSLFTFCQFRFSFAVAVTTIYYFYVWRSGLYFFLKLQTSNPLNYSNIEMTWNLEQNAEDNEDGLLKMNWRRTPLLSLLLECLSNNSYISSLLRNHWCENWS
jgi:hypothetical protein